MAKLKEIVYLSEAQKNELFLNNKIIVNGETIVYDSNTLYVTPCETLCETEGG